MNTSRALSYRQLLGEPDVRALLLATLLSRFAGRMFALAIVLYALTRTGSPLLAGWLAFAAVAPGLVISPIAGALIDRVGSAWAITVDMAASAICVTALAVVDRVGWADPAVLLVLTGCFSLTSPLSFAGIRALLPRLVPAHALDRANALDTAINGLTDIAGPALAGAIVGFGGPVLALVGIAVIYAAAALSVGRVRPTPGEMPRVAPLLAQAWHGLRRVLGQPTLRGLALSYSLYEICWGMLVVAVPVFAAQRFAGGAGAAVAGLLWAGLGLVGGITALVAGHLRAAGRERKVMAIGMLVTALAVWPLAAEFGLIGLMLGLMLVGAAAGPIDVGVLTLRQRSTEPVELGRVVSISMSLNLAGGPLGSALGGMLVTWSLTGTFGMAALASALAAGAVALIPDSSQRVGE
ncbi:MAG TPA: MFS transporter [Acetobacteraceae bacterium]|nr:MFS transporter [Acetobacteraceae bacterium]